MSNEFKKLTEVEVLEELSENAHVIVEDNGITRRYSAAGISANAGSGITTVIMRGNSNTLTIGDTTYTVGYSCNGSGSVSAAGEDYGVSPAALSLWASNHYIRISFIHCGNNLEVIKNALFNDPCFIKASYMPTFVQETEEVLPTNFGGMCQWATTQSNVNYGAGGDALFVGGVIVYLVQ